jgi:hypothetical protein
LRKLLSDPEARKIGKIFLLLPLMVGGSLLLAFVVLMVAYRFARMRSDDRSAIRVADTAQVRISAGGQIHVSDAAKGTEVNISANGTAVDKRGTASPYPQPRRSAENNRPSSAAKVLLAVNQAFLTAVRSTFAKGPAVVPPAPVAASSPEVKSTVASSVVPMAAKRPAWIDNPPQPAADAYELAVKAGPWKTRVECEQSLDEEIEWAVDSYVGWRIGDEAREQVVLPADYARAHLVKDQWLEKINTSLGEMYNLHALLSFDRQVEGRLRDAWTGIVTGARLVFAAALLGGVLLLLSVIYGYLKIVPGKTGHSVPISE